MERNGALFWDPDAPCIDTIIYLHLDFFNLHVYFVNVGKYTIHEFYGYIEPCFGTPLGGKHVAMGEGTERKKLLIASVFSSSRIR